MSSILCMLVSGTSPFLVHMIPFTQDKINIEECLILEAAAENAKWELYSMEFQQNEGSYALEQSDTSIILLQIMITLVIQFLVIFPASLASHPRKSYYM